MPAKKFGTIEQTVFFKTRPAEVYGAPSTRRSTGSPPPPAKSGAEFKAWDGSSSRSLPREVPELKMVHSKVPAEQVEEYAGGWVSAYWDPLRAYFTKSQA